MSLRITGGSLRGRVLRSPRNRAVRPTSSRVRESLFSILGQRMDGWCVLDLFSGAGTLGIEAVSRGASQVVFVEQERTHVQLIQHNAALIDGLAESTVLQMDTLRALRQLSRSPRSFDLVFCDPPYGKGLGASVLADLGGRHADLLSSGAQLVVESSSEEAALPESSGCLLRHGQARRYGSTMLTIYREGSQDS